MVSFNNIWSAALVAGLAIAQNATFNSSDIQSLVQATTPTSNTKLAWCNGQRALCGTLCGGSAENNTCDSTSLNFTCTCQSNHSAPPVQYYATSLVAQECETLLGNCLKTGASAADPQSAQQNCMQTYICGNATDADATKAASAASSPSSTGSASASSSGSSSAPASASSSVSKALAAAAYGEYAPPMFVMMLVGAMTTFL